MFGTRHSWKVCTRTKYLVQLDILNNIKYLADLSLNLLNTLLNHIKLNVEMRIIFWLLFKIVIDTLHGHNYADVNVE